MENGIIIMIVIIIIGFAAFYVWKAKKGGKKCIGCPDGSCCSSKKQNNGSCNGCNVYCRCKK